MYLVNSDTHLAVFLAFLHLIELLNFYCTTDFAKKILGATAVALGAIGAHAILKKDEYMKDTWKVFLNIINSS